MEKREKASRIRMIMKSIYSLTENLLPSLFGSIASCPLMVSVVRARTSPRTFMTVMLTGRCYRLD